MTDPECAVAGVQLVDDQTSHTLLLFLSFLLLSFVGGAIAIAGAMPPDPSVHWPGHSWIHFMKRLHVIFSIGCFLMNLCACFFSVFALHRTLAGGFDMRGRSAAEVLLRELEYEYVAVSVYYFAGMMLLMGPVGIRCFCMVQQGLRSDTLAAAVMCLIVGVVLLILSFFNAHLVHTPFASFAHLCLRFIELSLARCFGGGKPAVTLLLAWTCQCVSVVLAVCSLIETVPWLYYRELYAEESAHADSDAAAAAAALPSSAEQMQRQQLQPSQPGAAAARPAGVCGSGSSSGRVSWECGAVGGLSQLRNVRGSMGEVLQSISEPDTPGREEEDGRHGSPPMHCSPPAAAERHAAAPAAWAPALAAAAALDNPRCLTSPKLASGVRASAGLNRRQNSVASSLASIDSLVVD